MLGMDASSLVKLQKGILLTWDEVTWQYSAVLSSKQISLISDTCARPSNDLRSRSVLKTGVSDVTLKSNEDSPSQTGD